MLKYQGSVLRLVGYVKEGYGGGDNDFRFSEQGCSALRTYEGQEPVILGGWEYDVTGYLRTLITMYLVPFLVPFLTVTKLSTRQRYYLCVFLLSDLYRYRSQNTLRPLWTS
jgi:hypothetical protein